MILQEIVLERPRDRKIILDRRPPMGLFLALYFRVFDLFPVLDDRQITHLICVHLRHLLYDFF